MRPAECAVCETDETKYMRGPTFERRALEHDDACEDCGFVLCWGCQEAHVCEDLAAQKTRRLLDDIEALVAERRLPGCVYAEIQVHEAPAGFVDGVASLVGASRSPYDAEWQGASTPFGDPARIVAFSDKKGEAA